MIYLDVAATTKPSQIALATFNRVSQDNWMNPSSTLYSVAAKNELTAAREKIADKLGAEPEQIIFTSGSTEAANWVIQWGDCWDTIVTSNLEHPCVYNTVEANICDCYKYYIPNDSFGRVDLSYLEEVVKESFGITLVTIMGANNELGTINPVREISDITHHGSHCYYFADMTQLWAHGEARLDGIDFGCASAHKFGGFKGTGFLYVKDPRHFLPFMYGGHQEFGLRPGTENVAAIAAMADAFVAASPMPKDIKDYIVELAKDRGCRINSPDDGLTNLVSITIPDIDANKLITMLAMDEIYLSAGSACQTGRNKPSRVLKEIGLSDYKARCTIRMSFDSKVRKEDFDYVFSKIGGYMEWFV